MPKVHCVLLISLAHFCLGSQSLSGCRACEDGYYARVGMASCAACPLGTYASQSKGVQDYYKCPASDSPKITFYGMASATGSSMPGSSFDCTMDVGATACTPCPADRPYTWQIASTSAAECKRCPEGMYFDAAQLRCTACFRPCRFPSEYENVACTESTNRFCSACDLRDDACDLVGEYPTGQGCPGPIVPYRACARCTNKPAGDTSEYVAPSASGVSTGLRCTWQCVEGYYAGGMGGSNEECRQCSAMNSDTCKPGFVHRACSNVNNTDAQCNEPCDAEALGKPPDYDETSEWVWTIHDERGMSLVQNFDGGLDGKPNEGCMWKCKAGYTLKVIGDGIAFCV